MGDRDWLTGDEWARSVTAASARRHAAKFPFRNRWLIVKLRLRTELAAVWADLVYLVRG